MVFWTKDRYLDKYRISNYVYNNKILLYDYNSNDVKYINIEGSQGVHGDFINQEALDSNLNILYANYSTRSTSGNTYAIRRYGNLLGLVTKTLLQDDYLLRSDPTALKVSPLLQVHQNYLSDWDMVFY